jgi:4'-phosphopantetheinyl transferase
MKKPGYDSSEKRRPIVSAGEAHVWLMKPEAIREELTSRLFVLSAEERARMASFRFESDRLAYAAAHLLLRAALNWCAPGVPPAKWELTNSQLERPEVVAPEICPKLRFNISHTRSLVACLVTREIDCGVDVEVQRQVDDMEELAARVLSPVEISDLMALPRTLRPTRFFRYWTLKEAYVKARGLGLSLPLDAVSFDLGAGGITIAIDPSLNDHGRDWQFEQWEPTEQHVVAVAIRSGQIGGARVVRHQTIPVWESGQSGPSTTSAE